VTWYQGLIGLSDLLKFGLEDIYGKCLFRILLPSSESILINRNKLKRINCILKAKYIIHTKEIIKPLTYLALIITYQQTHYLYHLLFKIGFNH
jgi:hypothetical protein